MGRPGGKILSEIKHDLTNIYNKNKKNQTLKHAAEWRFSGNGGKWRCVGENIVSVMSDKLFLGV